MIATNLDLRFLLKFLLPVYLLTACATSQNKMKSNWKAESDKIAEEYTLDFSKIVPEVGSNFGYDQFNGKGIQIINDFDERVLSFETKWKNKIEDQLNKVKNPDLILDLEILLKHIENNIEGIQLDQKNKIVDIAKGSEQIFNYILPLVNDQSSITKKQASVDRFLSYVNGSNSTPLLIAYKSRIEYLQNKYGKNAIYPYNKELEKYLSDSPSYVAGVKEALKKSGRSDWKEGFKKFESQVFEYDKFIKSKILPLARKTPQMPSEIYAHILKVRGIDKSPEWLIKTGKKDFDEVFKKFELVAQQVAKKRNWKYESPAQIIERLKQEQVTDPLKVQSLYENVAIKLTNIIKENNLVSLPKNPIKIRVAGDAESLAVPVPHLNQPPLVNNKGERPEFVVPTSKSGKLPFDDFSYGAAALVLTAHEGRPGHDLQFSEILDRGLSLARARYAVNNVNIEGWALYAEDLVYPYIPLESQLVAIQTRLWRIARMYLDPEVQLQKVASVDVIKLFNEKLGVSKVMAQLEYDRYAFRDVGQAPSYYYGLLKIRDAKSKAQEVLKEKFDLKCFNDSLLEYGLVPVDKISSRLILDWECH